MLTFFGCDKLCELRKKRLDYVLNKLNEEFSDVNNVWAAVTNTPPTTKPDLNTFYANRSNILKKVYGYDNSSATVEIRKNENDSDNSGKDTKCNSIFYDSSWIEMLPDNIMRPPEGVLL